MRRSGLDRQLGDVLEFVYMDAPHEATGPPPADVTPFFEGPYRQWWATEEVTPLPPVIYSVLVYIGNVHWQPLTGVGLSDLLIAQSLAKSLALS